MTILRKIEYSVQIILVVVVLSGCNRGNILKVEFDNISGLDENSRVQIDGLIAGSIENIRIQPTSKILVEIKVDRNILIKQNAQFILAPIDLLGSKGIMIVNGDAKSIIDYEKIQQGQLANNFVNDSTLIKIMARYSTSSKLDSIENELKKLNKNVEELSKSKK